jgi:predicted phosphodiesterase
MRAATILGYLRGQTQLEGATPVQGRTPADSMTLTDDELVVSAVLDSDSLEGLIQHFKIDTKKWRVKRFTANKWDAAAKDNEGELRAKALYQIKAWFVPFAEAIALQSVLDAMVEAAKEKIKPRLPAIKTKPAQSGNCVEISIADLHMGKLAWGVETGGSDYDLRIARDLYRDAVDHLLADTKHRDPEKILMVVGNDLLHTDGPSNQTFGGTQMDADTRHPKVFLETEAATREAIMAAREIAPVHVCMVRGNHDWQSVWYLGHSLDLWFRDDERVVIDNSLPTRKFFEWGIVGLMFCHGHKGKKKDLPLISAVEAREIFGRTRWNEVHTGHLHDRNLWIEERAGIAVRRMPSLCAADAYHAENAFIGNMRAAEAIVWNKQRGLIGTSMFSVLDDRRAA